MVSAVTLNAARKLMDSGVGGAGSTPEPVVPPSPTPGAALAPEKAPPAPAATGAAPSTSAQTAPPPAPAAVVDDAFPTPIPVRRPIADGAPVKGATPYVPSAPAPTPASAPTDYGKIQLMDYRQGLADTNTSAINRTVGENELTSKQLSKLLDENGRYIQSARLRAREGAAASGMLMSSTAQGAAQRAAIDAGAPIAQADAGVYANTASENMRATNEDLMADQGQGRSLLGQTIGLQSQADEAQIGRRFQAGEAGIERDWRSGEAGLDRTHQFGMQENQFGFQGGQSALDRDQQTRLQLMGQDFQSSQAGIERDWRDQGAARDREFNAGQSEASRSQARFDSYANMQSNRESLLSQQLAAIFSNTTLKPAEQQAAANNARALFTSITASFNAAFAAGVPPIFANPYPMGGAAPPPPTPPGSP